ncbi:MAG: ATP-binding protein [Defluviicoccus sp.]|nr:ATP-binding protein [Defluviicoccus sp.]
MTEFVDASPAKRFFVEMLIRDIRLEDAVLDLIDNAIDSLIRHESIDLENLVKNFGNETLQVELSKFVTIDIKDDCFTIRDNCGGIDIKHAREQVFRLGIIYESHRPRLSV